MSTSNTTTKGQSHPSQSRYPAELPERAVRMVREADRQQAEGELAVDLAQLAGLSLKLIGLPPARSSRLSVSRSVESERSASEP